MKKQIILSEQEYDNLLMYKRIAEDSYGFVYLLKHIYTLGQHKEEWHIYPKKNFDLKLQMSWQNFPNLEKPKNVARWICAWNMNREKITYQLIGGRLPSSL